MTMQSGRQQVVSLSETETRGAVSDDAAILKLVGVLLGKVSI